jgi:hypothetical protein
MAHGGSSQVGKFFNYLRIHTASLSQQINPICSGAKTSSAKLKNIAILNSR